MKTNQKFANKIAFYYLVCLFVLLDSCETKENSLYPYFRFENGDQKFLLNYKKDDLLLFKNQKGQARSFRITAVATRKREYTVGMGFFAEYASKYYEFDEKVIRFLNQDGKINEWEISFSKQPDSIGRDSNNAVVLGKPIFKSQMNMWEWIDRTGVVYPIQLNRPTKILNLTINNKMYTDVYLIESDEKEPYPSSDSIRLDWDIRTLYFKPEEGILGFGNTQGDVWLLQE